ncbi:hypothetical protein BLA6863_04703 [Burkholderia lata]|uniref:Uncharacterized protein n=1 Tax=Burkholderia lata (strain ATCC 17760 / DSM 23089 / LMG 22485 / NCIMB 9086 / R18194 / 383) TaxID=482957 RepID=A0A6P2NSL9_BURL3|nr:hypothetical protein BLA6863_04703 [Burkholderia lata]
MMLKRSDRVGAVYFLNGGDARALPFGLELDVQPGDVTHELDVVTEMGARLPVEWLKHLQALGKKRIACVVDHTVGRSTAALRCADRNECAVRRGLPARIPRARRQGRHDAGWRRLRVDIERAMFDKPSGFLFSGAPYDAVWTIPEFERSCLHYYQTGLRALATIVPHIWHPMLFDKVSATLGACVLFGYQPGKPRCRVTMSELNICMVKTSVISMLVAEDAYRAKLDFLEFVRVCNTLHLKEQATFVHLAKSLDIVNHSITTFESRYPMYEFVAAYGNAVVSHM